MEIESVITELQNIVSKNNVLVDGTSKLFYGNDLSQDDTPDPLAIVFPENVQQIIEIVNLANKAIIGLVPSGGRTGYSGGAVAAQKEVVVSLEKMNRIINFNAKDRIVTCEAGVTTKAVQDFAVQNNLFYPVDFAAVQTCQIGGNIATNAGGISVIRYGTTRDWVRGLKVITGNGELMELNHGLKKNATGYDLRHLFIGSEGTLGFIVEASLKLTDLPLNRNVIIFSVPDKNALSEMLFMLNEALQMTAFEFFSETALSHVMEKSNLQHPFDKATLFYVLMEYESTEESDQMLNKTINSFSRKKIISNFLTSTTEQQNKQLWQYRKDISSSLSTHSPYKYDIAVLPSLIPVFMEEIEKIFDKIYLDFEIIWFGHLGDGNLHLNILKPEKLSKDQFFVYCKNMSTEVYSIIKKYHGTISAEHGIGLLKKEFLHYSKTPAEIDYMRQIKNIFDKKNIMNPRKII